MTPTNQPTASPRHRRQHDEANASKGGATATSRKDQPPITAARTTSVEGPTPPPGGFRTSREEQAVETARELIAFADGFEDAGHPALARRARNVARETIWLAERVAAEMSARIAMQEARDRVMDVLMERGK